MKIPKILIKRGNEILAKWKKEDPNFEGKMSLLDENSVRIKISKETKRVMNKEIRCSKHPFVVYPENKWCVICANEKANKKRRCETCGKMVNFYVGHLCFGRKKWKILRK